MQTAPHLLLESAFTVSLLEYSQITALTALVEGVGFLPWHQPAPQRGAVGFPFFSYWGSRRGTGSDR